MADTSPAPELTEDQQEEILYFILYFVATCLSIFFLILLVFLCFSGRICVYICYIVHKIQVHFNNHVKHKHNHVQPSVPERAPLIIETEYFPRPGYDGYCLLGQEEPSSSNNNAEEVPEDTRMVLVEAGFLLTRSIDIDLRPRMRRVTPPPEASVPVTQAERLQLNPSDGGSVPTTSSNFPRGILTPERRRAQRRHGESLKAVSFNPRTEFKLLEDV